jgi:ketosteroid isomerase-like protein
LGGVGDPTGEDQDLIREYLRLAGDPDLEAYLALWAPHGRIEMPYHPDPDARVLDGIDAIRSRATLAREWIPQIHNYDIAIRPLLEPGHFVCEYSGRGTTAAGAPYNNTYCSIAEVRDGKVVLWREYFNPAVRSDASVGTPAE